MSSRTERKFDQTLTSILRKRMHWVKHFVWPHRGKPPHLTKTTIEHGISELQDLAKATLLKVKPSKVIFSNYDYKKQWHTKRGKPFRILAKRTAFTEWYQDKITVKNCVYIFWQNRKCLYVGRTLNGHGRPIQHFQKKWFGKCTRIDVYGFDRKRGVPRFECMCTHLHDPTESKIIPARRKYYTKCPICVANEKIKLDLKYLFRLR